jgi:hypothetical protein
MSNGPSDFVQVQLSAAGVAMAGTGAQVRIANGHFSYVFTAGQSTRVLNSEWRRTLSLKMSQGKPIFQIAASLADAPAAAPAKANRSVRIISPVASHTDAPVQTQQKPVPPAPASAAQ